MNASIALQKTIFDALSTSSNLTNELGEAHIFDSPPVNQKLPFVSFGKLISKDWNTSTEEGAEHIVEIIVWSSRRGRKELLTLAGHTQDAIRQISGINNGHNFVNIQHIETVTERENKSGNFKASITFSCVTEPQV